MINRRFSLRALAPRGQSLITNEFNIDNCEGEVVEGHAMGAPDPVLHVVEAGAPVPPAGHLALVETLTHIPLSVGFVVNVPANIVRL